MVATVVVVGGDGGVGRIRVLGDAVGVGGHVGVAARDGADDVSLCLVAVADDRGGGQAKHHGAMLSRSILVSEYRRTA